MRQSAQSLSLLTTTVRASFATAISANSMPFPSQMVFSSSLIGREASEMSVSPAQNFSKPPPVPEVPTVTLTPDCSSLKSSAAAVVRGATVLDPSALTAPDSAFVVVAGVGRVGVVVPAAGGQDERTGDHGGREAGVAGELHGDVLQDVCVVVVTLRTLGTGGDAVVLGG